MNTTTESTDNIADQHDSAIDLEKPLSSESLSTLYSLAYGLYNNGKYADAKGFFRFLTLSEPFDRRFWMGLAASYQMLKEYPQAIECFSVAAVQNPHDPYVHLYAAECFFHQDDLPQARSTLEIATTVTKESPAHHSLLPKLELLSNAWAQKATGAKHA